MVFCQFCGCNYEIMSKFRILKFNYAFVGLAQPDLFQVKMTEAAKSVEKNIRRIAECSIYNDMNTFTNPRLLPCIHTFCFECLKRTGETAMKKPGYKMACPLCRKKFTIPQEAIVGLQKHFSWKVSLKSYRSSKM